MYSFYDRFNRRPAIPVVEIHLIQGYSEAERIRLSQAVTDAVRMVVPAHPDLVTVLIHEAGPGNYMRGGTARSPAPALPDPAQVVRDFLAAMEARDLKRAAAFLGDGFEMCFPGGARMTRLDQLTAMAAGRYRRVSKSFEAFEAMGSPTGTIVYCRGTLSGEWLDGSAFGGIRFIDRFELAGGRIIRQDVWNDLAEHKGTS